jgi:hypothetical protein
MEPAVGMKFDSLSAPMASLPRYSIRSRGRGPSEFVALHSTPKRTTHSNATHSIFMANNRYIKA